MTFMKVDLGDTYPGTVFIKFKVPESFRNQFYTFTHGGAISTYADILGPAAVYAFDQTNVMSVKLDISFVSAVRINSEVICATKVLKLGKRLAYT